jgi:hypothetical protein
MNALNESRPTPLDKEAVKDYAEMLVDDILVQVRDLSSSSETDFIDDHDEVLRSEFGVADVKTKQWKKFPVIVRSIVNDEKINHGSLLVGAGAGVFEGEFIVEIVINGAYTWQKLKELRSYLIKDIYIALLHELTHAADHVYDRVTAREGKPKYFAPDGQLNDEEYWNDPREIRAFLQEAVEEALVRAENYVRDHRGKNFTRDQVLDYVHKGEIWKQIQSHMNERNRAKILKAVYAALMDSGHI